MEPPSLLVADTTSASPLDIETDPVDRVKSAEHGHVVPEGRRLHRAERWTQPGAVSDREPGLT